MNSKHFTDRLSWKILTDFLPIFLLILSCWKSGVDKKNTDNVMQAVHQNWNNRIIAKTNEVNTKTGAMVLIMAT